MKKRGIKGLLKAKNQGVKLDIGCGANKQGKDWIGLDYRKLPGVDIIQDLEKFPWPLPDNCATLAVASHVVEHINPAGGAFIKFMDEVWRVLKEGGEFIIGAPYAGSSGYFQDPTHVNPCNEMTWSYFDPKCPSNLYYIYKPKPWKIKINAFSMNGNLEVVLIKRPLNPKKWL